jgi:hypothetical protein|tara:strand:+ start:451 stop:741 length:291 start_codon:yes stop_codon:yes gene_type:complete
MPKQFKNIKEKMRFFKNAVKNLDAGLPKEASPELVAFFMLHLITAYNQEDSWDDMMDFINFALDKSKDFDAAQKAVDDADKMLDVIVNRPQHWLKK